MKRIISLVLVLLVMTISVISVSAADMKISETGKTLITIGDWVYTRIDGDKYWEIDSYIGKNSELVIPRIVDDVMVVSLDNYCFTEDTNIKSVETSSPLWNIGDYAFLNCTNLEKIELNFALKTIGVGAFSGTTALKEVNLEDSVVTEIKAHSFMNSGIENVCLPDTCTKIGNYAFGQCNSLTKIVIPESVTDIHQDAFKSSDNVIIYCYTDSYAHQYAESNGIEYVLLDAPVEITFLLGDADNDGTVTIMDSTIIQRVLVLLISDDDGMIAVRGSTDGDELNVTHAAKIQRYLALFDVPDPIGTEVTRLVTQN